MKTQFKHHQDTHCVEWKANDTALLEYHYQPETALFECRRPYFHPLKTLDGGVVTNFRPADHTWHQGLSMTLGKVDDYNFWGGPTYGKDAGYRQLENVGRQDHKEWVDLREQGNGWIGRERLDWIAPGGERLLTETRSFSATVWENIPAWGITVESELTNVSGRTLTLGQYESMEELKGSHYTGLALRIGAAFLENPTLEIYGPGGTIGEAMHGRVAPWMMVAAKFPDSSKEASLLFVGDSAHSDHPARWFVRRGMPLAAFSFAEQPIKFPADGKLRLRNHVVIADGRWSEQDVEKHLPTMQKSWAR